MPLIWNDFRPYKWQTTVCRLYGERRMAQAVAYYRVSTRAQGRSALGLDAQREAVARFAEGQGIVLLAGFLETESGKGADALARRPQSATKGRPVRATG